MAEATARLEAAVDRLTRAYASRTAAEAKAAMTATAVAPGADPEAVAALAARLDATIARLRNVLGEEG